MTFIYKKTGAAILTAASRIFARKFTLQPSRLFPVNSKCSMDRVTSSKSKVCCTLIPGDGVGPDLINSLRHVFVAAEVPIQFDCFNVTELDESTSTIDEVTTSIRRNKVCIMGSLSAREKGYGGELKTINMKMRRKLDIYANVVHLRSMPGIKTRHDKIDCVVIRELTEGELSALEHEAVPGIVESLKITTRKRSLRIAKFAFDYATINRRKKVTVIHKANIMKLTDGLFLKCCEDVSKAYPRIKLEKMIVDNATMQLISNPNQFDVMVCPNLYGSILNNLCAGLVGGAGVVPGASYSTEEVIFEPGTHRIFKTAIGKNIANPTSMILCGTKLLRHINLRTYSKKIMKALNMTINEAKYLTKDLGGSADTDEFTCAVITNIKKILKEKKCD